MILFMTFLSHALISTIGQDEDLRSSRDTRDRRSRGDLVVDRRRRAARLQTNLVRDRCREAEPVILPRSNFRTVRVRRASFSRPYIEPYLRHDVRNIEYSTVEIAREMTLLSMIPERA